MTERFEASQNLSVLRSKLRETIDKARHDAAVFAILTVILTPIFIAVGTIVLVITLAFVDLPVIDNFGYEFSVVTGVNLALGFMAASFFLRPKPVYQRRSSDYGWLVVAASFYGALLVISHGTALAKTQPIDFWSMYLFLALAMLGCIGHAYEPHDDYYLGWIAGPILIDDFFTIEDDIDRAHISLGFAVALAHLVLASYAEIFGSMWLWHGLKESELSASVELLQALASKDAGRARSRMRALGKTSALDVIRALVKLEMITVDRGIPRLSLKGREFLGLKAW
ncbi:MAG: hypothetical protein ED859_11815 [Desulfuromonadales bacterium]|nr:MAG: hypothetical protein ED859_11815 [Desulfuromonadales bacterium]